MFPKIFFLIWSLFLPIYSLFSQSLIFNNPVSLGAGATGVSRANVWSVSNNPAGTAGIKEFSLAMGYYLPYFTKELSSQSVIGVLPFKYGVLSATLHHFGYQLFQENTIAINYANHITPALSAAFQLNWQNNYISQSGSGSQFYAGIGLYYSPLESVAFGMYLSNPEKSKLTVQSEQVTIPSVYAIGVSWKASGSLLFSTDLEKQVDYGSVVKFGIEYNIKNTIIFRTGLLGKPINYTLGIGYEWYGFVLDVAFSNHQVLGVSSSVGLSFKIPAKQ